ncbi:hypothetical protein G7059_00110 [Erysipelothrix sp. HDW6A]|nr:hypothetical protein [Erysipelothrix sp. HDW6A]QIK56358.1 hypothetical protein G7059_00110 [Erysipelothrix sp. HDW6A]
MPNISVLEIVVTVIVIASAVIAYKLYKKRKIMMNSREQICSRHCEGVL